MDNETMVFLEALQQTNHEFVSKVIFIIVVFVYLWLSIYYSKKVLPSGVKVGDVALWRWMLGFLMRYPAIVFLVLFPIYMIFLIPGYEFQTMLSYVIIAYTILLSLSIPLGFLIGGEYIVKWVNKLFNTNFSIGRFNK